MSFYLYLAVLAVLASPVWSFSGGAPNKKETCADLTPRHLVGPQTSEPPYLLKISKTDVKPSETIEIKLIGKTNEDLFKGFMVQARSKSANVIQYVGVFDAAPSNGLARLLDCESDGDTLTHKKIEGDGIGEISFNWTPSADAKGSVDIVATVVKNGVTYWVGDTKQSVNII